MAPKTPLPRRALFASKPDKVRRQPKQEPRRGGQNKPGDYGKVYSTRLSQAEVAKIDRVRGHQSRAAWIHDAVAAALK